MRSLIIGAGEIVIVLAVLFLILLGSTIGLNVFHIGDATLGAKMIEWTGLAFAALLLALGVKPRDGGEPPNP